MSKAIKDVMTGNVEVIFPHSSIRDAAEKMKKLDVGMLPVCDSDRLVGTITDRDITIRAVSENYNPEQTKVRDVMTRDLAYCYEDEPIESAAQMMQSKQIRRIIILNRNKRLCGVVSLGDLAVETKQDRLAGRTLERISEPTSIFGQGRNSHLKRGAFAALGTLAGAAAIVGGYRFLNQLRSGPSVDQLSRSRIKAA